MRSALLIFAALGLLVCSTGFVDPKAKPLKPSVRVAQWSPLVVVGERFRPFQTVVLEVTAGPKTLVRRLRTSRRGTFVVRFAAVISDRCNGVSIIATGAGGRVAKMRLPEFLCPPAIP
jgi:hypothetical protein